MPTIVGKVTWRGAGATTFCADEWKRAQAVSGKNVSLKYTLPGPMTIIDMFHK